MLKDSYKHKGLRKRLVDELRKKGISDRKILQAFTRFNHSELQTFGKSNSRNSKLLKDQTFARHNYPLKIFT